MGCPMKVFTMKVWLSSDSYNKVICNTRIIILYFVSKEIIPAGDRFSSGNAHALTNNPSDGAFAEMLKLQNTTARIATSQWQ